ncbi:hypothetical protein [Pseudomonas sp. HUK17]|uniref:hypothetical protein n=1 Tax=Pseudomonas sp. HUK17 TaxID=1799359 RepID=UPI000799D688|nr:hypothetical protein [Pseudomonas sp. HUK17]KXJ31603.1 hypothetical protein AX284_01755 [Pseudomonas sp. HUK17]
MSYQTLNSFRSQFTFPIKTESFKYDSKECRQLMDTAIAVYSNPAFAHSKVKLHATTLNTFSQGVLHLASEGYTLLDTERSTSSGNGSYGINFLKPASLQGDDKRFIEQMIQDAYVAAVEVNAKALQQKLKADLLADEAAKEAEKVHAQRAKKDAEAQKKAVEQYEQMLKNLEEQEQ